MPFCHPSSVPSKIEAREIWPLSLHGVGLALGSAAGIDPRHPEQPARLGEHIEPLQVSDHACFSRGSLRDAGPVHAADLLPIPIWPRLQAAAGVPGPPQNSSTAPSL